MDPDPDFSGSDPDFWPIRIRTQKKSLIRIREKKPDPKHWKIGSSIKNEF